MFPLHRQLRISFRMHGMVLMVSPALDDGSKLHHRFSLRVDTETAMSKREALCTQFDALQVECNALSALHFTCSASN